MSPELIGILSVGVSLAGLILWMASWFGTSLERLEARLDGRLDTVEARLNTLDSRLDKVEQNQAVLLERTKPLVPAKVDSKND